MRLGEVLRSHRHMERLGLRDLAKQIGISATTLSNIERGKTVDQHIFTKLLLWLITPQDRAA